MKIIRCGKSLGALVEGIDLSCVSTSEFDELYQAFLQHKVLFFRQQTLTPETQLSLAEQFGELESPHPFFPHVDKFPQVSVIETTPGNPPGKSYWHTDMTWQAAPPKCAVLCAQHLPRQGGDTIWVSMEAVYASLPRAMKKRLQGLSATHAVHGFAGSRFDHLDADGTSRVEKVSRNIQSVNHPLVAKHPETGQPTLYINEQFTRDINDKSLESEGITLTSLFLNSRKEEFQVRFSWEPGSVVIWDNRCTQHFAVTDYGDEARRLHRVVVKGTAPQAYDD